VISVRTALGTLLFEIKELGSDENFSLMPGVVSGRTVGNHIRRKIAAARKQVKFGAGKMTVTLFDKVFSKVKIPYENLPPCFDVRRVEITGQAEEARAHQSEPRTCSLRPAVEAVNGHIVP